MLNTFQWIYLFATVYLTINFSFDPITNPFGGIPSALTLKSRSIRHIPFAPSHPEVSNYIIDKDDKDCLLLGYFSFSLSFLLLGILPEWNLITFVWVCLDACLGSSTPC